MTTYMDSVGVRDTIDLIEDEECDYCGITEGDVDGLTFSKAGADTLCQFCALHPFGTSSMCLYPGTHQSLCDCACGVCD